jgi:hypothetical protein
MFQQFTVHAEEDRVLLRRSFHVRAGQKSSPAGGEIASATGGSMPLRLRSTILPERAIDGI